MNVSVNLPSDLRAPYQGYAYSYPHKLAYRSMKPRALGDVWAEEPRENRFLYVHVPFCEMRCGFCNLLTLANPAQDMVAQYLDMLEVEARVTSKALGAPNGPPPARISLGGGTPTYLSAGELDRLFNILAATYNAKPKDIFTAVETSPKTATEDRLQVLKDRGVRRISIGAQSFNEKEAKSIGRPQKTLELEGALSRIRAAGIERLNIDLIYGAPGQTPDSWKETLAAALDWGPEEIYLYPLYVRPETGIDGRFPQEDKQRLVLYRLARDVLGAAGYVQRSMRSFERQDIANAGLNDEYSCQEDGMIGLGPGARSYVRDVHYSTEFGVSRASVLNIVRAYCARDAADFATVQHGIELDVEERMRRFVIKSVLRTDGLDLDRFRAVFDLEVSEALPELETLVSFGLLERAAYVLRPTAAGLERSDAIGPWLYSKYIKRLIKESSLA